MDENKKTVKHVLVLDADSLATLLTSECINSENTFFNKMLDILKNDISSWRQNPKEYQDEALALLVWKAYGTEVSE